jgi:hypothetical protein
MSWLPTISSIPRHQRDTGLMAQGCAKPLHQGLVMAAETVSAPRVREPDRRAAVLGVDDEPADPAMLHRGQIDAEPFRRVAGPTDSNRTGLGTRIGECQCGDATDRARPHDRHIGAHRGRTRCSLGLSMIPLLARQGSHTHPLSRMPAHRSPMLLARAGRRH